MFTLRIGPYVEGFLGDNVLNTHAYNYGVGVAVEFMY